ncbi:MAG: diguanylate cyclase [Deltaproteobacteria bacterium]|nr:diguanylate cyclase [Deltaproteobacteria bacterium]
MPTVSAHEETSTHSPLNIPDLEVCEVVGQGAFSVVYRALHKGEELAIKVQKDVGATEESRRRVWAEAATLARLRHPNLCRVRSVGEAEGRLYIAMTYLRGMTLAERIRLGRMPETEAVAVARQIASALDVVHRAGMIHGDIKPGNILLDECDRPYLIDFGLATRGHDASRSNTTFGTLTYASPEQNGFLKRAMDGRSDLYALGVVLFEMLVGRPPITAKDPGEVARQHATLIPPTVRTLVPSVSEHLSSITARLLAKEPDDRFQHAVDLMAALSALGSSSCAPESMTRPEDEELPAFRNSMRRLTERFEEIGHGQGCTILLSGGAGEGKSYLAERACAQFRRRGRRVLVSKASVDDPMPFSTLAQLLTHFVEQASAGSDEDRKHYRALAGPGALFLQRICPSISKVLGALPKPLESGVHSDNIHQAAIDLLTGLAHREGGLVLFLDNVQWLDEATRQTLSRFAETLPSSPVLILATARTGSENDAGIKAFQAAMQASRFEAMTLSALDRENVHQLISTFLSSAQLSPNDPLVERLAVRSRGNPMEVTQYLHLLIESGHLKFVWDDWVLDEGGLNRLSISDSLLNLVVERLSTLSKRTRAVLVLGALLGIRFERKTLERAAPAFRDLSQTTDTLSFNALAATEDDAPEEVQQRVEGALREALALQIIEATRGETYVFLHDRLREALLAHVDPRDLPRLHRTIARALDPVDIPAADVDRASIYALARHYWDGRSPEDGERAMNINWAAGAAALSRYAFLDALRFLEQAKEIAAAADLIPPPPFFFDLGLVCAMLWRKTEARAHFQRAIESSHDSMLRARCYLEQARLLLRECDEIIALTTAAIEELGYRYPAATVTALLKTLLSTGIEHIQRRFLPRSTTSAEEVERARIAADCFMVAGLAEFYRMRPIASAQCALFMVNRGDILGESSTRVRALALTAAMLGSIGLRDLADRVRKQSLAIAERIGDPAVLGLAWIYVGYSQDYGGHPLAATETYLRVTRQHGRWLSLQNLLAVSTAQLQLYLFRGLANEALALIADFQKEVDRRGVPRDQLDIYSQLAWMTHPSSLLLRRKNDDTTHARLLHEAEPGIARGFFAFVLGHAAIVVLRTDPCANERFEDLCRRYDALNIAPFQNAGIEHFPLAEAWIRLNQVAEMQGKGDRDRSRSERLRYAWRRFHLSLKRLRPVKKQRALISAHLLALEAKAATLRKKWKTAERLCEQAEQLALRHGCPWALFETMLIRASIFVAYGWEEAATRELRQASRLAIHHGWAIYLARIKGLIPDDQASKVWSERSSNTKSTFGDGHLPMHDSRILHALLQVGLASTNMRDSNRQATIILDELIKLLDGHRAFLFLSTNVGASDPKTGEDVVQNLDFMAGRNSNGEDLGSNRSYLAQAVGQAYASNEAVVRNGVVLPVLEQEAQTADAARTPRAQTAPAPLTDGAPAPSFDVLAVPLSYRDVNVGVAYVDRPATASGFTEEDVSLLSAVGNHVAIALETSRLARLDAEVGVERAQRLLAEHLGSIVATIVSSLDLREILQAILEHLTQLVPYRRASILLVSENSFRVAAQRGFRENEVDLRSTWPKLDVDQIKVLRSDYPYPHSARSDDLGEAASLLLVPLRVRDELRGLLCIESQDELTEDAHVSRLAETLGAHAAAAIENARLFETLQQQATSDSLTGLFARRHFMALAERELSLTIAKKQSLAVMVCDVDHFKKVNDTYGHAIGDLVLVEVAKRLLHSLRETDLVGRVGGEEFCVLLPEVEEGAAAALAERARLAFSEVPVSTPNGPLLVTISAGLAVLTPDDVDLNQLIARADEALYASKRGGRNRVSLATV